MENLIFSGDGAFRLPKVPLSLLEEAVAFLGTYAKEGLEAACCFYYDKVEKRWGVSFPSQRVSGVHVDCDYSEGLRPFRDVIVIQAHSHHKMTCSFSRVDDKDELAPIVYALFNCFDGESFHLETRTNRDGKFINLDPGKIFEL